MSERKRNGRETNREEGLAFLFGMGVGSGVSLQWLAVGSVDDAARQGGGRGGRG